MMVNCLMPEPLVSAVLNPKCMTSDMFGVDYVWFVVRSNLRVEVSSNQHVCACLLASFGVFLKLRELFHVPVCGKYTEVTCRRHFLCSMIMMIRGHSRRSRSAVRSIPLSTLSICANLMQKLKQNCDPVLGALGPSPALSNPDKAHLPSASLPISRYVSLISRSETWRVAVALLLHHSMDMYRMSNAKWHDNATLHTSQSCRPCCIAGLEPGIVSASSSTFHVLWFSSSSSSSVSPVSLLFSAYSSYSYAGTMYSYGGPHIMLLFERTRC